MKLGSLFDGSGTCPLASTMCGIEPVWASEIEKYPVAVTTKRFPMMKHLGDITKINGAEIEPVDIITFGSPCTDLSIAGKREGLEAKRSGLFFEATRIIREMRSATNDQFPRFAMWENVPGAYSSNSGNDFLAVLQEMCAVTEPTISIPRPDEKNNKLVWRNAGSIMGDGYSIAWRTIDAQYWGVPQRRKRIFLVSDFRGRSAEKILFEREGLRRDSTESGETRKRITSNVEGSVASNMHCATGRRCEKTECNNKHINDYKNAVVEGVDTYNQCLTGNISTTLRASRADADHLPCVVYPNVSGTLCASGAGLNRPAGQGNETDMVVVYPMFYAKQGHGEYIGSKNAAALRASHDSDIANLSVIKHNRFVVRRITPMECSRLQGLPDGWDDIDDKKLQSDSAQYKMWGNGMALPCILYVMQGIKEAYS